MDLDAFKKFVFLKRGWVEITWRKSLMRIKAAQARGLVFEPWDPKAGEDYLLGRLESGCTTDAFNSDVKLLNVWHLHKTGEKERFQPRKRNPSTFRYLTADEVRRVFTYRHRDPYVTRQRLALFLWAIKSGMRSGEVAAMDMSHLSQKDSKFLVAKPSKRGKRRWNPIEKFVWSPKRPFMAYLARRPVSPTAPDAVWLTVFPGHGGGRSPARRMSSKALTDALRDMGRAVGLEEDLNFNVTRHTRGMELYRLWGDLKLVQVYLGHSSIQSTEVYAGAVDLDVHRKMRRRPGNDPFQPKEDDDDRKP